jgi:hypothetical protein
MLLLIRNWFFGSYLRLSSMSRRRFSPHWAFGLGDGTMTRAVAVYSGEQPRSLALRDINTDGALDLVVADASANRVSVLIGSGDGSFAGSIDTPCTNQPTSLLIHDLNDDAIPDLAVAFDTGSQVGVAIGHGDGSFSAWAGYSTDGEPTGAADFDGNGWPDLILQQDGMFTVLFNDGDGVFAKRVSYPGSWAAGAEIMDSDADGRPDLVVAVDDGEWLSLDVLRNTCE